MLLNVRKMPFSKTEYIILAISGGIDSMVLLDLFKKQGFNIVICHVNHNQRKESEIEEKYLREYAKANDIPFELYDYHPKDKRNFQAVAHQKRYEFFYDISKKYNARYILTAHHKDDLAETILLRLITGSNLYGYAGISKETPFLDKYLYRPLLECSREEINQYAIENNIKYFEDSSNSKNDYLRNRIRHNILPLLKNENPNILDSLTHYSSILKDSFEHIRKESINYLKENNNSIRVSTFLLLDNAVKKDIICYMLEQINVNISYKIIEQILSITNKSNAKINLSNNYIFYKEYDNMFIKNEKENENKDSQSSFLTLENKVIYEDKYLFYLTENKPQLDAKYLKLCYNNLQLPLEIRSKKDGDFIVMPFGRKKIKNLFIDMKIPMSERAKIPIVVDNCNNCLWVYDLIKIKHSEENKIIYLVCEEIKNAK